MKDKDRWAARAGWHLTASKVNGGGGGLDLDGLLRRIEKEMPKASPEVQWRMNNTLAAIGIHHAGHRKRAVAIGEKIGLYKDWPVSKGCTPPYVPVWVEEMVRRMGWRERRAVYRFRGRREAQGANCFIADRLRRAAAAPSY